MSQLYFGVPLNYNSSSFFLFFFFYFFSWIKKKVVFATSRRLSFLFLFFLICHHIVDLFLRPHGNKIGALQHSGLDSCASPLSSLDHTLSSIKAETGRERVLAERWGECILLDFFSLKIVSLYVCPKISGHFCPWYQAISLLHQWKNDLRRSYFWSAINFMERWFSE